MSEDLIAGRALRITHPDKIMYPATGTTKRTVIDYYLQVAPHLIPLAADRPVTRKRWVNGVGTADEPGQVFFRKDLEQGAPDWVPRIAYRHKNSTNTYPLASEPAVLAWFGQLAALEVHVPQWQITDDGTRQNPDRFVLDLDPGPGVRLEHCVEVAFLCRDVLTDMGLESVPVTSGSKGVHLYAKLDGTISSDDASAIAKELARAIEGQRPDLAVSNMRKDLRGGKVLIDWSQNSAAKTTVCPYSLRGRPRPMVAAPRTWEELGEKDLMHLTFRQVLDRLEAGIAPMQNFGKTPTILVEHPASEPDKLEIYRSKRDPQRTPEPVPAAVAPASPATNPIFVIQKHAARRLHWDFRLEHDDVLVSWAVPKGPPLDTKSNRLAVQTEDHPMSYASFEGEIPKGEYGGGTVEIWDSGTIEIEKWRPGKEVIVNLYGQPGGGLGGVARRYALIHTGKDKTKDAKNWLLHLTKEQPDPVAGEPARGVESHTPRNDLPRPMLATRAEPGSGQWCYEMKWDGVRAIAQVTAGGVAAISRNGNDITATYPELQELTRLAQSGTIVDGELVALNERGVPDFGVLQRRMKLTSAASVNAERAKTPVYFMVFDLLADETGSNLNRSYAERRKRLLDQVEAGPHIMIPPAHGSDRAAAFAASKELGLEGVIAKRTDSTYTPGHRSDAWRKIKHERHQEVAVIGWRPSEKGTGLASVLVAVPNKDGKLRYAGRVGTGFSERDRTEIRDELEKLERETAPVADVPRDISRDAHWVRPELVGEVRFTEFTRDGALRHPAWRGWRPDKKVSEIERET
ncbi:MAG TPA: ATP-dependent DNA ligase [Actinomycetales bacterium]|nr:ATP-dependent DNA ligase [Actinomycetales bacterium]